MAKNKQVFGFGTRRDFDRSAESVRRSEGALPPLRPLPAGINLASQVLEIIVEITGPSRDDVILETRVWPGKIVAKNYLRESSGEDDWLDSQQPVFVFDVNDADLEENRRYRSWTYGTKIWTPQPEDMPPDDPETPDVDESVPVPIMSVITVTDSKSSGVECVRVSSLSPTDGRYPGKIQDYDVEAKTWSDRTGGDCWVVGKNGVALQLKRYEDVKSRGTLAADSKPVYAVWEGEVASPTTTSCKAFGWLLSGPRSNKVWRVRVSEATGKCADCTTVDPEFDGTTDRIAYHTSSPSGTQEIWEVAGNLILCGGCATARILTNRAATTPSARAQLEVTYKSAVDGSIVTKTFDAECTPDDGTVVWAIAADDLCPEPDFEAGEDYPCASLIRVTAECFDCEIPNVSCGACLGKLGPPVYKVAGLPINYYPKNTNPCGCSWTVMCGDDTVTVEVGATTITVTVTTVDGTATYIYDTNDEFPGLDCPPDCLVERTIPRTTGGSPFPLSVTITPFFCTSPPVKPCIEGTPDLICTVVTGKTQTKTMPYDTESGYVADGFVFGDETGCNPPAEEYGMGASCGPDGCGGYMMSASELAAPTGETVPGTFSYTSHSTRPVYITFSGTLRCCILCDSSPGDTVDLPYTGTIKEVGMTTPYWCVDGGSGVFLCVQAVNPPEGTSSGPYRTLSECQAVCDCQGVEGRPSRASKTTEPEKESTEEDRKVQGNKAVSKYLYPCQHRSVDPIGEKATCAEGCQKGKDIVGLFECQHFGELVSLSLKTTQDHRTCRGCAERKPPE